MEVSRTHSSQTSCLGAWIDAGNLHVREMHEEEERNGLPSEECWVLSYQWLPSLYGTVPAAVRGWGRQRAEELIGTCSMSQMTKELLLTSNPEPKLPALTSHG